MENYNLAIRFTEAATSNIFKVNSEINKVMKYMEYQITFTTHHGMDGHSYDEFINFELVESIRGDIPVNGFTSSNRCLYVGGIQFYHLDSVTLESRRVRGPQASWSLILSAIQIEMRKKGVLVYCKAKSQTDLLYFMDLKDMKVSDSVFKRLLSKDLFKEGQRLLGQKLVVPSCSVVTKGIIVDFDRFLKEHYGLDGEDWGDGMVFIKEPVKVQFKHQVEDMYSLGMRIVDCGSIISTCKGNAVANRGMFRQLCQFLGVHYDQIDMIIPKSQVKVGNKDYEGIFDIYEELSFVSYVTRKSTSFARIPWVSTVTHGKDVGPLFARLLADNTEVFNETTKLTKIIEGDIPSFVGLVQNEKSSDMLGAALSAAFPVYTDKWHIMRNRENVNNLYMHVAATWQKKCRKSRIYNSCRRRAAWSPAIEKENAGNTGNTGLVVADVRKGIVHVDRYTWTSLGLGDYDGDDCYIYYMDERRTYGFIARNPMSGITVRPFVQKGFSVNLDETIPEFQSLVSFSKMLGDVDLDQFNEESAKEPLGDSISEQVTSFIDKTYSAGLNSPALGIATNGLYQQSIDDIVRNISFNASISVSRAFDLENKAVKAIKSKNDSTASLDALSVELGLGLGRDVDKALVKNLYIKGIDLNGINTKKLGDIIPFEGMDDVLGLDTKAIWDMASKYNYQCSYENYIRGLIKLRPVAMRYTSIALCKAFTYLDPKSYITSRDGNVRNDISDVKIANQICRNISKQLAIFVDENKRVKLQHINPLIVRKVNDIYTILTKKVNPSDKEIVALESFLVKRKSKIASEKITGPSLVKEKINIGYNLFSHFVRDIVVNGERVAVSNYTDIHKRIDAICDAWYKGSNYAKCYISIRDIKDVELRSFAYSCIHAFVKWYVCDVAQDSLVRANLLFKIGIRVFNVNPGSGELSSSRLFWLILSTFDQERIMKLSYAWKYAQYEMVEEGKKEEMKETDVPCEIVQDVVAEAAMRMSDIEQGFNPDEDMIAGFDIVDMMNS